MGYWGACRCHACTCNGCVVCDPPEPVDVDESTAPVAVEVVDPWADYVPTGGAA